MLTFHHIPTPILSHLQLPPTTRETFKRAVCLFCLVCVVRLVCLVCLCSSLFVLSRLSRVSWFVSCVHVARCLSPALSISCVVCPVCFVLIVTLCISNLSFLSVLLFYAVRPVCSSVLLVSFPSFPSCASRVLCMLANASFICSVLFCLFLPYSPLLEFFISPVFCFYLLRSISSI